jgi:hypothetical protein
VCVACGAATVDQRALEQLVGQATPTAPPVRPLTDKGLPDDLTLEEPVLSIDGLAALGEAGFESELEHLRDQRRRQLGLLATMGVFVLLFVIAVPTLVVAVGAAQLWVASMQAPEPPPAVPMPVAEPAPMPEPAPVEPEAEPEPPEEEEPDEPEQPEEPPAPQPVDPIRALIKEGWSMASSRPEVAAASFRRALELRPGSPEASYGLGYCLLKQQDLPGARPHLCAARTTSDADIRRDVDALLANNGLTCSP